MKSLISIILYLSILALNEAIRLRGETYPGLRNINFKIVSSNLHKKSQSRIVGGEIAPEAYAPWQVSLQNQYGFHFCGGVIITDQYVLTAASCLAGLDKRKVRVVTSTNNYMNLDRKYYIEDIIIHCMFDRPLYHNDIALIKLTTMIEYDEKTQNITLAKLDELEEGEILTMTGWGSWKLGHHYPEKLKKLNTTLVSNKKCKKIYGKYEDNINEGHLCAQPKSNSGACHGDTGGPLVNSKGQLVGIGNWGVPCAYGFPDVFARLSYYYDWIRTNIMGCVIPPYK